MLFRPAIRLALALGLLVAVPPVPALAQDEAGPGATASVIVLNVEEAIGRSQAAKGVREERARLSQKYQNEFSERETDLRDTDEELKRQRSLLAPDAFSEKRKGFEKQVGEFQREVRTRRRALEQAYAQAMQQVKKALIQVVGTIADERDAELVLASGQLLLFDSGLDITDQAVTRLNKQVSSVPFPDVEAIARQQEQGRSGGQ